MGRSPCCDKEGLKKGPWTPEEDMKLIQYIHTHGAANWRLLPKNAGLQRCGKSCRLRWTNYLRPDIKRGRFSFEEEETIIQLHSVLGNKWSAIAARLPGRTDNEIKNYWNTHIRKRLLRMGIDPVTHAPRLDLLDLSTLLGSSRFNMSSLLRLHTLINPEGLRLALSLLSSGAENPNLLLQKQILDNLHNQTQFQNVFNQSSNLADSPLPDQPQFIHQNNLTQAMNSPSSSGNFHGNLSNFIYGVSDHMKADLSSENSSVDSVVSARSATTFINGNTEDEKESDVLRFEIPESLEFDYFM